jgi:hypothetical protein
MSDNPLLTKLRLPGKMYQLPSRGIFYKLGELDPNTTDAELQFHSLTAFEEITIKNVDLLYSGKALGQVLKTAAPQILKSEELYSKDVDAIMLFLRLATYGPEYELTVNHGCEHGKTHSYIVNLDEVVGRMKYLDPTRFDIDYKVKLDNGQEVIIEPIKYKHVIELLQENENKTQLTADDMKKNLEMSMLNIVKSVDGIEDRELIKEWIRNIPSKIANQVAERIELLNDWGPDLVYSVKCKDCGETFDIEIPINPISLF